MVSGHPTPDSGAAISRALLSEIPTQLLSFMEQAAILPNPRPVPHYALPPMAAVPGVPPHPEAHVVPVAPVPVPHPGPHDPHAAPPAAPHHAVGVHDVHVQASV